MAITKGEGGNIMKLSDTAKNLFLPKLGNKTMTEDEYLNMLDMDNEGVDYGRVMYFNAVEASKNAAFVQSLMQPK